MDRHHAKGRLQIEFGHEGSIVYFVDASGSIVHWSIVQVVLTWIKKSLMLCPMEAEGIHHLPFFLRTKAHTRALEVGFLKWAKDTADVIFSGNFCWHNISCRKVEVRFHTLLARPMTLYPRETPTLMITCFFTGRYITVTWQARGQSTTHLSRPLARLSLPRDPSALINCNHS